MKQFAICISGHMRNYQKCFTFLKKNILDKLDCDIFIHTWHDINTNYNNIIELYAPVNICIEQQKIFNEKYANKNRRSDNTYSNAGTISMYYKIYECNNLKIKNEKYFNKKYKCVIRARPDLFIDREIPQNDLNDLSKIYITSIGDNDIWIDDTFAFSSSENMDIYSATYNYLDELYEINEALHPETILKLSLNKFNTLCSLTSIKSGILRINDLIDGHNFHKHLSEFI